MKRKILITMTIALALVLGGGFYLLKKMTTPQNQIKETFNIQLEETKLLYDIDTKEGFHNDGVSYEIYQVKNTNAEFLKEITKTKDEAMEKTVNELLKHMSISKENSIDWDKEYTWQQVELNKGFDILYLILLKDSNTVYAITNNK